MTGQEARDGAVHWIGDAPTSLHGNGAGSFERTTRDPAAVTCKLCLSQLALYPPAPAPEARDNEREVLKAIDALIGSVRWTDREPVVSKRVGGMISEALVAAGYRKHPEPEITDRDVVAVAIAKAADGDYWKDEIREWEESEDWEREAHPDNYPSTAYEDRDWWRKQADAAIAALRVPVGEGEQ